jgi:hypothetical protein
MHAMLAQPRRGTCGLVLDQTDATARNLSRGNTLMCRRVTNLPLQMRFGDGLFLGPKACTVVYGDIGNCRLENIVVRVWGVGLRLCCRCCIFVQQQRRTNRLLERAKFAPRDTEGAEERESGARTCKAFASSDACTKSLRRSNGRM